MSLPVVFLSSEQLGNPHRRYREEAEISNLEIGQTWSTDERAVCVEKKRDDEG